MKKQVIIVLIGTILLLGTFVFFGTNITGSTTISPNEKLRIEVLEGLKLAGAELYTLPTCGHCKDQKEILGKDYQNYITEIDCSQTQCTDIQAVPAWKISGQIYSGTKTLKELADILEI